VTDTFEDLLADILVHATADAMRPAKSLEKLCRAMGKELATVKHDLLKAQAKLKNKDAKIRELKGQIAKLNKMVFDTQKDHHPNDTKSACEQGNGSSEAPQSGSKSAEGRTNSGKRKTSHSKPKGRKKREFPPHLERKKIYMGTEDKLCPCGCGGTILGYDTDRRLETIPAQHYVAERMYPKYRCRAKNKIVGTPYAPNVFPHSWMTNSVVAHAIFLRFGAYQPWNRQETLLLASGIKLSRSTLMKWANRTATQALLPIYQMMLDELRKNSERLFMDETIVRMLMPGAGKAKHHYMFALHRDDRSFGGNKSPVVAYIPSNTRSMAAIHDVLAGVTAIVQSDAYAGYGQLGRQGTVVEGVVSVKCWAHARRHFTDDFEFNRTADAQTVIEMIAELYAEEAKIRGRSPVHRMEHRKSFSAPILKRLKQFLEECSERHLPRTRMAKAIGYVQKHWAELILFLDDGRIDLDTNSVERMFKPTILLRKNVLFMGSEEGAKAWGIMSSIVETCKLNGVNVEQYLKWVLDQIAGKLPRSQYGKLLPWNAPVEFRLIG
jgi:transposase